MRIPEYVPGAAFIKNRLPPEVDVSPEADGLPAYLFLPLGFQFNPEQLAEVLPWHEAKLRADQTGGWVIPLLGDDGEPFRFSDDQEWLLPEAKSALPDDLIIPGHPDYPYKQWCRSCLGCNGCGGVSAALTAASGNGRRRWGNRLSRAGVSVKERGTTVANLGS